MRHSVKAGVSQIINFDEKTLLFQEIDEDDYELNLETLMGEEDGRMHTKGPIMILDSLYKASFDEDERQKTHSLTNENKFK